MLIDARALPPDQIVAADICVCVVGAGAAGIALARALAGRGLAPVVLEAGGPCGLDPDGFDLEAAAARHPRLRAALFPLAGAGVELALAQVARARRRFGSAFRAELKSSDAIRVFLHAPAAALLPDPDGRSVASVRVVSEPGRGFTVQSRAVVLAAGAIETARLLLLSTGVHVAGIGNDHGVIGRYFMEHPRVRLARVRILERPARGKLYDTGYAMHRLPYCLRLQLPYAAQAGEGIGHAPGFIEAQVRGSRAPASRPSRPSTTTYGGGAAPRARSAGSGPSRATGGTSVRSRAGTRSVRTNRTAAPGSGSASGCARGQGRPPVRLHPRTAAGPPAPTRTPPRASALRESRGGRRDAAPARQACTRPR